VELEELGEEGSGDGVVVSADEAGEAEEIEEPPEAETPGGDPEGELGARAAEVEIVPAEE
jgi:hypothetical protein